MPAMLEDPTTPVVLRTSGEQPYPTAGSPLPPDMTPRQVTLRDRVTIATIVPFSAPNQVPVTLLAYLSDQLNREIEKGDTYPMLDPLPLETFGPYWFGVFGAVMVLGDIPHVADLHRMAREGYDWEKVCLGSFYIKPNYPGRSSHVCNGGLLVTDGARNRGVGRLMGETYLEWAPRLGYTYSVFNLVYETNVVSCRLWDSLGFKRIGRVKGCGNLRSYPDQLVDAIIFGRDLGQDDEFVSEERFDKIRFYLKNGKYPNGADRAEKSRLRSAATHYKLVPAHGQTPEKLVLKGKEVISDPQRQYEIARIVHYHSHGGINKTTAAIAEIYHWVRIKETVSQVIRNCPECSEMNKGLHNSRRINATRTPPGGGHMLTTTPTQQPQHRVPGREESPSDQLQMEARASVGHPFNSNSYPLVDPALMDGLSRPGNIRTNEEDLPSPFLAAGRGLPAPPPLSSLDLPTPDLPAPIARMSTEDTTMSGMEERAPTAKEEIRRRLTRAGFSQRQTPE